MDFFYDYEIVLLTITQSNIQKITNYS